MLCFTPGGLKIVVFERVTKKLCLPNERFAAQDESADEGQNEVDK